MLCRNPLACHMHGPLPGFTLLWQGLPSAFNSANRSLTLDRGLGHVRLRLKIAYNLAVPKKSNPAPRQFKVGEHLLMRLSDGRIVEAEVKAVVYRR